MLVPSSLDKNIKEGIEEHQMEIYKLSGTVQ